MEKDLRYIGLFDLYKGLLTEKQRDLFSAHFYFDLSLAEIAEEENASRQSVFDAIKKVKAKLDEYEKELRLKSITDGVLQIADRLTDENAKSRLKSLVER